MSVSQDNHTLFAGRVEEIEAFWHLFHNIEGQDFSVLSFYGIGGIGKTSLQEELNSKISTSPWSRDTIISRALDFDTREGQPSLRDLERALYALRDELRQKGIQFRTFDIAYAHYWEKTHPEVALQQKDIPFINEGSAALDLLGGAKDLTESLENFASLIVSGGMLPKALTLAKAIIKAGKNWFTKQAVERLQKLNDMRPGQLLRELIYFLAYDIRIYQEKHNRRFVFFLDTYEALWWEAPQSQSGEHWSTRDEWVRDLVSQLPNALWIICGRNSLHWDEVDNWRDFVKEMPLGDLSETDAKLYLQKCGITDQAIVDKVIQSSQGIPYALALQVEQYNIILSDRKPNIDDFANRSDKLFQRFTQYLDFTLFETLKLVAVARVWDPILFRELIRRFQTGYPATAITELSRFSFIIQKGNQYKMHELMRYESQNALDNSLKIECHNFLFSYYEQKLKELECNHVSFTHEFALEEALYHKLNSGGVKVATLWFNSYWMQLSRGNRWALCLQLCLQLKRHWEFESNYYHVAEYNTVLYEISLTLKAQGQYIQAMEYCERALRNREKILGKKHPDTASSLNTLGDIYYYMGKYSHSLKYYNQALRIRKQIFGEEHLDVAISLNNIGVISYYQGKYEQALGFFQQSLSIRQIVNEEQYQKDIATSLNSIGNVYYYQGKYEQAIEYYEQALEIRQQIFGELHSSTAVSVNNIGLVYGDRYQHKQALKYHQKALSIRRQIFGEQHPDVSASLNNIGLVYYYQGKYSKALKYHKQVLKIDQQILGEQHPETAHSIISVGNSYINQGAYDKAFTYYQQALSIRLQVQGKQHPETATLLNGIGNVYYYKGRYGQALKCYQQALKIRRKILGEKHQDTGTSLYGIGNVYFDEGKYNMALEYFQKAFDIRQQVFGDQHPDTIKSYESLLKSIKLFEAP